MSTKEKQVVDKSTIASDDKIAIYLTSAQVRILTCFGEQILAQQQAVGSRQRLACVRCNRQQAAAEAGEAAAQSSQKTAVATCGSKWQQVAAGSNRYNGHAPVWRKSLL